MNLKEKVREKKELDRKMDDLRGKGFDLDLLNSLESEYGMEAESGWALRLRELHSDLSKAVEGMMPWLNKCLVDYSEEHDKVLNYRIGEWEFEWDAVLREAGLIILSLDPKTPPGYEISEMNRECAPCLTRIVYNEGLDYAMIRP